MLDKSGLASEGLSTFAALIEFLSSVNPHVLSKGGAVVKGFPTFVAFVILLSTVNPLVDL